MDIRTYQQSLQMSEDIWGLWEACRVFTRARGLERFYYAHFPPLGAPDADDLRFCAEGFASDVVAAYFQSGQFRASQLMKFARTCVHPFYWDEVPQDSWSPGEPERAALTGNGGPINGLCVPLFGPNGRNGLASLQMPAGVWRLSSEIVHELQWAAMLAHLRYCELWVQELGPEPHLSPREQEVLVWVARGKSNPSIAEILGISAHTVDAHLRRIYLKLGVFDRITAAVRAMGVGLISTGLSREIATPAVLDASKSG